MPKQHVLKYDIKNNGRSDINLPVGAMVVKVAYQGPYLRIWVVSDVSSEATQRRSFEVTGTGHEFDYTSVHFLDTVFEGQFVWHVFEVLVQ